MVLLAVLSKEIITSSHEFIIDKHHRDSFMIVLLPLNFPDLRALRSVSIDPLEGYLLLLQVILDLHAVWTPLCSYHSVAHFCL